MVESLELLRKLQVKPGARLWLLNVPDAFAEALTAGGAVQAVPGTGAYDGALAFAEGPGDVAALAGQILTGMPEQGLLWFAYRKGAIGRKVGLTRDIGWEPLVAAGWQTVRSISLDEAWTGLRFRPDRLVKNKG